MGKLRNERGQALIELIIFMPMMFMIYSLIGGFANAINGSINQQKITRAYFYYRAQNNSTLPKPDEDKSFLGWSQFGMFFIGWKERFEAGTSPVLPCYRLSIPFKAAASDKCEEKYTSTSTQYIRVGTVYGVCGATYVTLGTTVAMAPDYASGDSQSVVDPSGCLIQ